MEIVLGISEEAKPKACSSEIGSAKEHDESDKNCFRVSENREQKKLLEDNIVVEEEDNDSTLLPSLQKKVKIDASSAGNGETSTQRTKRQRKKSKYFSSEYLSDFSSKWRKKSKTRLESSKVLSQSQVGEQMTNASDSLMAIEEDKLDTPCELLSVENGEGHQELSEEVSNAVDFLRLGATNEELRDLIRVSALGTQYPKDDSSRDIVREFMSIYRSFTYHDGANNKFLGNYNSSDIDKEEVNGMGKERKYKKHKAKQQTEEIEQIEKEENETHKHEIMKKERKPKTLKSKQADEEEGPRKESSEITKKERKHKKPESKKQANEDEEEETLKESNESMKKFSGAELFVTFGPGSNLPKKEVLIETYEKFGALEEKRTFVSDTNLCACVAFLNIADGEKAFESSQEICPFNSTFTVNFRLKYPNQRVEEKKAKVEVAKTTMEMEHLKKKLKEMMSLVDESEGGMTEAVKMKLVDEMMNLLEKVKQMQSS